MPGESIKYFRKQKGISQEKLAEEIGIPRPLLSYIETNKVPASFDLMRKIAEVLGCYVHELDKNIEE